MLTACCIRARPYPVIHNVRSAHSPSISKSTPLPPTVRCLGGLHNHSGSCMVMHECRHWSLVLACTPGADTSHAKSAHPHAAPASYSVSSESNTTTFVTAAWCGAKTA
jgi:hypothetical protein